MAASDLKWPQRASGRKWPQVTASGRRGQVAASDRKWPQRASGRKWPQVAAFGKWPRVAASGRFRQVAASGRKWPPFPISNSTPNATPLLYLEDAATAARPKNAGTKNQWRLTPPHFSQAKEVSDGSLVCGACHPGLLVGQQVACQVSIGGQ